MRDIPGYEGLYAITSCGRVWSHRRQKFLVPVNCGAGYCQVTLCNQGERKKVLIHRLVAEAFIPNPLGLPQVNHKDENKTNNNINNLEWVTAKENANYGTRTERMAKGLSKPVYCVELNRVFESGAAAAAATGVNRNHISDCVRGCAKTAGGYHWELYKKDKEV